MFEETNTGSALDFRNCRIYNGCTMKQYRRDQALEVVRAGYNRLGNLYTADREKADNWNEIDAFTALLPVNGRVLDAGSGTGIPIARHLAQSGYNLLGIDFSETMLSAARENVPAATFRRMNMVEIDLPHESFDGVISILTPMCS